MASHMSDIIDAMCSDPTDFVYAVHDTGLILAADTQGFRMDAFAARGSTSADIGQVISAGGIFKSGTVQGLSTVGAVESFWKEDTSSLVYALTSAVLNNGCEDYSFGMEGALGQFAATLRRVTGNLSLSSCEDVRPYCTGMAFMVRIVCPETCGCSMPRSGLWRDGPERGCPRAECQSSPKYRLALAQLPCEDPDPATLRNSTSWNAFWEQWSMYSIEILPSKREYYSSVKALFLSDGCGGLAEADPQDAKVLCHGTTVVASIADFCPVACECRKHQFSSCPIACLPA